MQTLFRSRLEANPYDKKERRDDDTMTKARTGDIDDSASVSNIIPSWLLPIRFLFAPCKTKTKQLHTSQVGLVSEDGYDICLLREKHVKYLKTGLGQLSAGYVSLDASRPWIAYWCLHSLDLLEAVPIDMVENVVSTLQGETRRDETGKNTSTANLANTSLTPH